MSFPDPHPAVDVRAVVVTPTVGEDALADAMASVQGQTHVPTRHVVVVDGAEHEQSVRRVVGDLKLDRAAVDVIVLPTSTGRHGHFGHRIYGAIGPLVHDDIVLFLDADNLFDAEHVATCVRAIVDSGAMWVYALRRIVDPQGRLFCLDDCDSLGFWPRYQTYSLGEPDLPTEYQDFLRACPYLIDTSCFALRREVLVRWSRCWDIGWGADGVFSTELVRHEAGVGTGLRTVSYRVDVDKEPDVAAYFLAGNELASELYGARFPWIATEPRTFVTGPEPRIDRFGG
jgi:hypothetical protein